MILLNLGHEKKSRTGKQEFVKLPLKKKKKKSRVSMTDFWKEVIFRPRNP